MRSIALLTRAPRAALLLLGVLLPVRAGTEPVAAVPPVESGSVVLRGDWTMHPSTEPEFVQLGMHFVRGTHEDRAWSSSVPRARVVGLAPGAFEAGGPVEFRVVRDAGTLHCRGSIRAERAEGEFELRLDPGFPAELERRGIGRPSREQQISLAVADAGFGLIDALAEEKYPRPDVEELVRLGDHAVREDYVRELAALGYRLGSLERLEEARDHGVNPRFIRGLREEGISNLRYEQLLKARDHGVNPQYVRAIREEGGTGTIDDLIELRDHGVDRSYLKRMRKAGFESASLDELRAARDHGVSAEYVTALVDAGFPRISLAAAIRARDHGLGAGAARRARQALGAGATIDDAIAWSNRRGR